MKPNIQKKLSISFGVVDHLLRKVALTVDSNFCYLSSHFYCFLYVFLRLGDVDVESAKLTINELLGADKHLERAIYGMGDTLLHLAVKVLNSISNRKKNCYLYYYYLCFFE